MEETAAHRIAALSASESEALRALAGSVAEDVAAFAHDITEFTLSRVPELGGPDDHDAYALTYGVARANVGSMATMLKYGVPAEGIRPPEEALDYAVGMLRRGVDLAAIMRSYQVGHRRLWRMWMEAADRLVEDRDALPAILDASSEFIFAWIDTTGQQLVLQYAAERERWLHGTAAVRMEAARAIVAGQSLDVDVASGRMRYELRRHHVAIVGWIENATGDDARCGLDRLERTGIEIARSISGSEPLVIPGGLHSMWIWTSSYAALDPEYGLPEVRDSELRFAVGEPGHGIAGFSNSHRQARQARQLVRQAALRCPVVRFRDVALACTLCADPDQARDFAVAELGPLSAPDAATQRLRETLAVYLEVGASPLHAAERLGVHAKTVAYRVRRVEELLGRPVPARRRELEAALLVHATLGPRG